MTLHDELRSRYRKGGGWRELFDTLASYTRRVQLITAATAEKHSGLAYATVVECFKELGRLQVGKFKYGRHGKQTRLEWSYSPQSVGKVAQGKTDALDRYDDNAVDDEPNEQGEADNSDEGSRSASTRSYQTIIATAKQQLADELGVQPEQIEITIKH